MRTLAVRALIQTGLFLSAAVLTACGGGGAAVDDSPAPVPAPAPTYRIGGSVSGLAAGTTLGLVNNGSETLALSADGAFAFPTAQAGSSSYAVTLSAQPAGQVCSVSQGSGTVATADISSVAVSCAPIPTYRLGGTVSGLLGGTSFTLVSAGSDSLSVNANGSFRFETPLTAGTAYTVTAGSQPAGQTCSVSEGSGTIAAADVGSIAITCTPIPTYRIGGSVSGLGTGLTLGLTNNGGDARSLTANGSFAFPTAVVDATPYAAGIAIQPTGQTCVLANGSGTVNKTDITTIGITCTTNPPATYAVRATVSGLASGASVSLRNNGGSAVTVGADGSFDFPVQLNNTAYAITVGTQPSAQTTSPRDQTCTIANGNGTIAGANVTNIAVTCLTNTYSVGGTITGLTTGGTFTLMNNGGGALTVSANGSFTFAATQLTATAYAVSTGSQPSGQSCLVSNGTGMVATSPITGISVTCGSFSQFALVVNYSGNSISTFAITPSTGALVPSGTAVSSAGSSPNSIAVTPNGKFAYVTNQASYTITAFAIDASTGTLTQIGSPVGTGDVPANVTMHPGGNHVYVANRIGNSISAYAINPSTGALSAVAGSPFGSSNQPRDIAFNPAGTYAYVTNWGGNTITAYTVNTSTGALAAVSGGVYATGADPYDVTVDPTGRFVYTVNYATTASNGSVSAYAINAGTGALTAIGAPVATGAGPFSLTVDSAGRTLYVANYSQVFLTPNVAGNSVSTYAIDGSTGALSAVGGTVATGAYPNAIKLDTTGSWAYVANSDGNTISRYSVNASTGALTSLGTATPAGSAPWALAIVQPTAP